jgi:transposase
MSRAARADTVLKRCGRSNVVRAVLREAGLKLGTPARSAFAGRVRELAADNRAVMPIVQPLLAILATMLAELARLTRRFSGSPSMKRSTVVLMTVPGVGPMIASTSRTASGARGTWAPISGAAPLSVRRDRFPMW